MNRVRVGDTVADIDFIFIVENVLIFEDIFLNDILILLTGQLVGGLKK